MRNRVAQIVAVMLLGSLAWAQGARKDEVALTTSSGAGGKVAFVCPGAQVRVCTKTATFGAGVPCSPTATIFTDNTFGVAASNPFFADGNGNFHTYALTDRYVLETTCNGAVNDIPDYFIGDTALPLTYTTTQGSIVSGTGSYVTPPTYSKVIPAGFLSATGGFRVKCMVQKASGAHTFSLGIFYGGTNASLGVVGTAAGTYEEQLEIVNGSVTNIQRWVEWLGVTPGGATAIGSNVTTIDTTLAQTVQCMVNADPADSYIPIAMIVEQIAP